MKSWFQRLIILAKIALVFVLLGFIVLFLMDKLVMPLYTRHGQERLVPDLEGLSVTQAKINAKKQGYRFQTDKIVYDDHFPAGTIIEQIPPEGTVTKSGRIIRVVASAGEKRMPMPRLIGVSPQGALNTAASLGLMIPQDSISYRYSDQYPKGVVFQQSIPQDSVVCKGTIISIAVSLGQEPMEFIVPKLLGLPFKKAKKLLIDAGLSVGTITYRTTKQYPKDTVLGQSIKSETTVSKGTPLDLLVAQEYKPDMPSPGDSISGN